jgi:hypothetical protein
MKRTRRNQRATCKAQVVLAAVKGDKTVAELAEQFSLHIPLNPAADSERIRPPLGDPGRRPQ